MPGERSNDRDVSADPRGCGFRSRVPLDEVTRWITEHVACLEDEAIATATAAGRVLAEAIVGTVPVPPFDRAAMDGYAVRAEETFGADPYTPCRLQIIGRSMPGRRFPGRVGPGQAVAIATGAPIPEGADAVVPVEFARSEADWVAIHDAVSPGRHVGRMGEDVEPGDALLPKGRILRPQDLGILSAVGIGSIRALRRPRVALVITGDEILPACMPARDDRIADMNAIMLAALVERDGGLPEVIGPIADDPAVLRDVLDDSARAYDATMVTGGSSTGPEDHAPRIVAQLGELNIHGIAVRPASPAGLGMIRGRPVALIPGNPVSCLCAYDLFAGSIVRRLGGRPDVWPYRRIDAPLLAKLSSSLGRVDYARIRLVDGRAEPLAISGASILTSTTRADGFLIVPDDSEGYPAGEVVTVWLYDA